MRAPVTPLAALSFVLALLAGALELACGGPGEVCVDGECRCPAGEICDWVCEAPPCHAVCEEGSSCVGECGNGSCTCEQGSSCEFDCQSPPCHVECQAGSGCAGTCANGNCECALGSECVFECQSGPCHVTCEGDNPSCAGECANGTCRCGPRSECEFECLDGNCHHECEAGASCLLRCPGGGAGESCTFDTCASGELIACPDGLSVACNRECPIE